MVTACALSMHYRADCSLICLTGDLYALGVAMERCDSHGEVCVHPSAMTPSWHLKQGAPLQSA